MLTGYSWRQMLTEGSVQFAQAIVDQLWNSRDRTSYHEQGTLTLLDHFVEGLGTRAFDLRCNWTWADTQSLNNECGMQCWGVWIPKSVFWKSVPSEAVAFTCPWGLTVLVSFHVCIPLGLFPAMLIVRLFTLFLCLLVINEISHLIKSQSASVPYMTFLLNTHEHAHTQRAR